MSKLEKRESNRTYLSIVQGTFRQSVPSTTEGAIKREWEVGGNSGVKYELEFHGISGKIIDVGIYEGDAGGRKFTNLNVILDKNEETGKSPVVSVGVDTRYATDIMRKLPNVNLGDEVNIRPYSFEPDGEDKKVIGVELKQLDSEGKFTKKVDDFFYDKEKKEVKNGMIVPEEDVDGWDGDDWKMHFTKVRKFLVKYTQENICPKFEDKDNTVKKEELETIEYDDDDDKKEDVADSGDTGGDIKPEDIPF